MMQRDGSQPLTDEALQESREAGHGHLARIGGPFFKVGKVLSVHNEGHTVDVITLDGQIFSHVHVASDWLGTSFGRVHMTAGTFDKEGWSYGPVQPLCDLP